MDTIKQFLEADAKRTQGEWINEYSEHDSGTFNIWMGEARDEDNRGRYRCVDNIKVYEDFYQGDKTFEEAEANANFIALASTLAPAIRTMLADIEMAREALLLAKRESTSIDDSYIDKALSALDKYKGGCDVR